MIYAASFNRTTQTEKKFKLQSIESEIYTLAILGNFFLLLTLFFLLLLSVRGETSRLRKIQKRTHLLIF